MDYNFGIFKDVFQNVTHSPKITIKDHCGRELFDISSLCVEPTHDGTALFAKKFQNLSISCGSNSIFSKNRRSCNNSSHQRRAGGYPTVNMQNGRAPIAAPVEGP